MSCLARQQTDRLDQRHVVALGHMLVALAAIALVEHRPRLAATADHAPRAERLDPRLLDAFEDRARGLAHRHAARMHGGVVIAQLQRHRIGGAAHRPGFGIGEIARRRGRRSRVPAAPAGSAP